MYCKKSFKKYQGAKHSKEIRCLQPLPSFVFKKVNPMKPWEQKKVNPMKPQEQKKVNPMKPWE